MTVSIKKDVIRDSGVNHPAENPGAGKSCAAPTLYHRLNETGFHDNGPLLSGNQKIEDLRRPEDTFDVFPADSAQAGVLAEAMKGSDLLVTGAAGTGKSVTIANLLSNAAARGKSTLVLAPTDAALQTVEKWLNRAGLGHLALKLGNSRDSGQKLLEQLEAATGQPRPVELPREETIHKLKRSQDRMNEYARVMGGNFRSSGLTPWQIITEYIKMESSRAEGSAGSASTPDFDCPEIRSWDGETFKKVEALLSDLEQHLSTKGSPVTHLFFGVQLAEAELDAKPGLKESISSAAASARQAREATEKLFNRLGIKADLNPDVLEKTLKILDRVAEYYTEDGAWFEQVDFSAPELDRAIPDLRDCVAAGRALGPLRASLRKTVKPEAFEAPNLEKLREILSLEESSSKETYSREIELANELLGSICQNGKPPVKTKDKLTLVSELISARELGERILEKKALFAKTFGARWMPDTSSSPDFWSRLEFLVESSIEFNKALRHHPGREALQSVIHQPAILYACDDDGTLKNAVDSFSGYLGKRNALTETLKLSKDAFLKRFANADLTKQQQVLCDWELGFDSLKELCRYQQKFSPADIPGLNIIIDKAERWNLAGAALVNAVKENWLYGLMNDFLTHCPLARQFEPALQNEYLAELVSADRNFRQVNSNAIALRHWDNQPHLDTGGEHRTLLDLIEFRETEAPSPPDIIKECSAAILRQAPIILGTVDDSDALSAFPESSFDLLICDEASQLTADAVSTPAKKARQLVAFGDEAQLAPEKEKSLIAHLTDQGAARRELPIHYRSLDGKLLDPVNRTLYSNSLKTFPNAARHGGGAKITLEQSKDRQETIQKTAELVKEHARKTPGKSLAVLTLDKETATAVKEILVSFSENDQALKAFLSKQAAEPFQVVPVEEFQGNERDCVIAALSFEGSKSGELGRLSLEGGEKMLNVMASRPREDLVFVSTLNPELMQVSPSIPAGEKLLRRYLLTGKKTAQSPSQENTALDDALQDALKTSLEKRGLTVVTNVGSGTLGVDLAIVDPNDPSRFILGILTDGARSSKIESALEREVIIPDELKRRGWNIRQLWCLEYLNRPEETVAAIADQVFTLAAERKQSRPEPGLQGQVFRESQTASAERVSALVQAYRKTSIPSSGRWAEKLEDNLLSVVSAESPVHQDEVLRRLAVSAGIDFNDESLQTRFASVIDALEKERKVIRRDGFVYSPKQEEILPRNRSKSEAALRRWQAVAPEERQAAVITVLRNACRIQSSELPTQVWKLLGLSGSADGFDTVVSQDFKEIQKQSS